MQNFTQEIDLARFEPGVFGAWFLSSQVLCGGDNGIVAGTQFTAAGVDFTASQVRTGQAIWLESADGAIRGAFEIVDVIDSGHLTVSVMRVEDPSTGSGQAIPIGSASGLTWRIVTYAPQAYEVLWELSQTLGLSPGAAGAEQDIDDVVNADALRQVWIFGILATVFETLYAGLEGQDVLLEKKEHYLRRYETGLSRLTVRVDTDGDGDSDRVVVPGVVQLVRR